MLPYYNYSTKNKSFVKMSDYLKENGIKNNIFMLSLFDKGLLYIDPYDPKLSKSIKRRIINEYIRNPWYYFREVLHLPAMGVVQFHFI